MNLVKLCVGIDSVEQLEQHIAARPGSHTAHVTRMRPKQDAAILNGGALYWVIKGVIQARQTITDLEEITADDGTKRCRIVLAKPLIRTQAAQRRPFQGWRYLKPEDSPPDLPKTRAADDDLPAELAAVLAEIGLR